MNKLLSGGKRALAEILAGNGTQINGMYIIYSSTPIDAAPDVDLEYLDNLVASGVGGYARVPITGAQVDDTGAVMFAAMVTTADIEGCQPTQDSKVRAAVLVCMKDSIMANDKFVYSTIMKDPVQLVPGAYMTINVKMVIGE